MEAIDPESAFPLTVAADGRTPAPRRPEAARESSPRLHPEDAIALYDVIEHIVSADQPRENRVVSIQVRLRRMGEKVLTAAGVRTRQRHADRAALISVPVHLI